MNYYYYLGDGPKIPPKLRRHLHRLRLVGTMFMVSGIVMPFLMLVKLLASTYFLNFLAYSLTVFGPLLYLVGMAFNNSVDQAR